MHEPCLLLAAGGRVMLGVKLRRQSLAEPAEVPEGKTNDTMRRPAQIPPLTYQISSPRRSFLLTVLLTGQP